MASPFKFFRKNQTLLLVIIGLLTMVAFIILPSVLQMMQVASNIRQSNNSVVTQKYGNLTSNDVLRLKNQQSVLAGFFSRLVSNSQMKIVAQSGLPQSIVQQFGFERLMGLIYTQGSAEDKVAIEKCIELMRMYGQVNNMSDRSVVANWLKEHKAAEKGITVSDEMVMEFINKWTDGLEAKEYNFALFGEEDPKETRSVSTMIEAIRSFITREALDSCYNVSWNANTTGERLSTFCRLNQFANVELYPVNVKDFVEKVADPTEAEIKGFFEVNKDKEPLNSVTDVGLRQPQKVSVDYCIAFIDSFSKPEAITDEQVQKYYDDNKENFVIEKKDDKNKTPEIGKMPEIGLNTKEYKPLDDALKNDIRQALAYQNAQEQMLQAIGKVQKAMEDYTVAKDAYEMNFTEEDRASKEDVKAQAPKAVDFVTLAKENGLTYGNTGLVSIEKFMETPMAKLRLADTSTTIPAFTELFGKTSTFKVGIYEGKVLVDKAGNPNEKEEKDARVIAGKCDDLPAHTPTLDEEGVKDQIIAQFKFRAAKALAQAEADKLVKKAIEEKLPLKVCLGNVAFVPPEFSWLAYASVNNPNMERRMYLGAVEGVQDAGYDFMQSIFQMNAGEIKVIANASETTYYVTRMIELTPPFTQLNARFVVTPEREYIQARSGDYQIFNDSVYQNLEKEAGLTWVVRPDEDSER